MGSLSIWHWLIVLLSIGVIFIVRRKPKDSVALSKMPFATEEDRPVLTRMRDGLFLLSLLGIVATVLTPFISRNLLGPGFFWLAGEAYGYQITSGQVLVGIGLVGIATRRLHVPSDIILGIAPAAAIGELVLGVALIVLAATWSADLYRWNLAFIEALMTHGRWDIAYHYLSPGWFGPLIMALGAGLAGILHIAAVLKPGPWSTSESTEAIDD